MSGRATMFVCPVCARTETAGANDTRVCAGGEREGGRHHAQTIMRPASWSRTALNPHTGEFHRP